jgi:hypothetical protein
MPGVKVRTLKAFRNGTEGVVRAGREIVVSSQRASELERLRLVTYVVGGKMEQAPKNKMEPVLEKNKEDEVKRHEETLRDAGLPVSMIKAPPDPVAEVSPIVEASPAGGVKEVAPPRVPTEAEGWSGSPSGGRTGKKPASRSSSRQGRRRKK